jgi:hypothetical protein
MLALLGLAANLVPSIAGMLLGSKAQSVTETVVNAAKEIFGTDDPGEIQAQIAADASKADRFKAKLQADTEQYRIQVEDTISARGRDVEVRKLSGGTNARANVMLIGNFVAIIVIVLGIIFYRQDMPDGIAAILGGLVGNLATMLTQAFNFEFGSSRGSAEKSDQLTSMIAKVATKDS